MQERKIVPTESDGARIDKFLTESFGITRSQIKKWISGGHVLRNTEKIQKAGEIIHENDEISVDVPEKEEGAKAKNIAIDIVFENGDFLVVKKPAGIPTHPDDTHRDDTLSQRVFHHCRLSDIGDPDRPGVVHRLDKDTSGLLIFAKNNESHYYFTKLFADRNIEKHYLTLVHGKKIPDSGTINSPIMRDPSNRKKMIVSTSDKAKHALSHFDTISKHSDMVFLRVKIETGRTHQIRVHFSAINHPVVGDTTYGSQSLDTLLEKSVGKIPRMFLHAESLAFVPPNMKEKMEFTAELPIDLEGFLKRI